MAKIWANRILGNTKKLSDIIDPTRKAEVIAELQDRLAKGVISQEQYDAAVNGTPEGE